MSGRGFGKTWVGANYVIEFARKNPGYPVGIIGQTVADVRDTMIETGESSILNQSPPGFKPLYEPSKRRLTWPNGAIAITYSGDKPDQLRGPQHGLLWFDELAKFKYPQLTWDNGEFGLRLGDQPHAVVTTTPRPIKIIKQLIDDEDTRVAVGSTYENAANLPRRYLKRLLKIYEGTRTGRQELHAEILEDALGSLWKRDTFDMYRVLRAPHLDRVVIGVDPPGGATECGIVAAGITYADNMIYTIEDRSIKASPAVWGQRAVDLYYELKADAIVGEMNYGGDMVEHTIRTADGGPNVAYRDANATRGKAIRAEPISSRYEKGYCRHVGQFAELEDECCSWEPNTGMNSPNRLDALVWAHTELLHGGGDMTFPLM